MILQVKFLRLYLKLSLAVSPLTTSDCCRKYPYRPQQQNESEIFKMHPIHGINRVLFLFSLISLSF